VQVKELMALIEADAVKTVFVAGNGSAFSITINKKYVLCNGRGASSAEKTYTTLPSLFKFLHESGLGKNRIEFDITNWTPYVPPAKRAPPHKATKTTTKGATK
jgi:hypothetical protein